MSPVAVLAAGGTGGHLFPAAALAEALAGRGWRPHLVTDRRGAAVAARGGAWRLSALPAAGLAGRGAAGRALALPLLAAGLARSLLLLRREAPAAVVGFGSYASVPPGLAAGLLRIPLLVHEANAVLGRANRLLARRARVLATAFRAVRGAPPACPRAHVGMPVRAGIEALGARAYRPPAAKGPARLLVTGGSQGARAVGRIVPAALARLDGALRARLDVLQQARPEDVDAVRAAYRDAGIRARVVPFVDDMAGALGRAHLALGRAGAATVAENAAAGRPAVYLPLPGAIDGHQDANAAAARRAGAGWVVREGPRAPGRLAALVGGLLAAPERLAGAARRAGALNPPGASGRLADLVVGLAGGGDR